MTFSLLAQTRPQADCGQDFECLLAVLEQFAQIAQGEELKGHFALADKNVEIELH